MIATPPSTSRQIPRMYFRMPVPRSHLPRPTNRLIFVCEKFSLSFLHRVFPNVVAHTGETVYTLYQRIVACGSSLWRIHLSRPLHLCYAFTTGSSYPGGLVIHLRP